MQIWNFQSLFCSLPRSQPLLQGAMCCGQFEAVELGACLKGCADNSQGMLRPSLSSGGPRFQAASLPCDGIICIPTRRIPSLKGLDDFSQTGPKSIAA
mmetsp:Transcript_43500/g.83510  ORF Transcript_43500/g.83510 Transcript_43500/m.83510 type:complete len:98 (+) Transcript_43500:3365-3658(+)